MSLRRNLFRLSLIIPIGLFIAFVGLVRYSTSPSFCNSCHIMKPFYESWKTSGHNFVPCVDCHYPPGATAELKGKFQALSQVAKFVTGTYSTKPYAEIEDASCLRMGCHEKRLISGKATFKRGIIFDHEPHLTKMVRGKVLRCTSCHSQIVQGSHVSVTESVCFICHFKGAKAGREENPIGGCPFCHESPKGDIKFAGITFNHADFVGKGVKCQNCHFEAIKGEGEVPKQMCLTCHGEPERLSRYDDTEFIHTNHVTNRKVECFQCHIEIKHAVKTSVKPLDYDCDTCHTSKHVGVKEMYMGTGGKGVKNMPSTMFIAQVDCIACHMIPESISAGTPFTGRTYRFSKYACTRCHGEGYDVMPAAWKEQLKTELGEVENLLKKSEELIKKLKQDQPNYLKVMRLYKDALHNYDFVKYGQGVHNMEYALALLAYTKKNAQEISSLISQGRKAALN